eukprot:m.79334 g.79334  ORF g.79334 m.79334 type:complete len:200 (+) comp8000_c0_seq2:68-667(+)
MPPMWKKKAASAASPEADSDGAGSDDREDAQAAKELAELTASAHKALAGFGQRVTHAQATPSRTAVSPDELGDRQTSGKKRVRRSLKPALQSVKERAPTAFVVADKEINIALLKPEPSLYSCGRLWMCNSCVDKEEVVNTVQPAPLHLAPRAPRPRSHRPDPATARVSLDACLGASQVPLSPSLAELVAGWRARSRVIV